MAITDFKNFSKENKEVLGELVEEAKQNKVDKKYLDEAEIVLHKMRVILDAQEILACFNSYPIREYPPEPKWDKRRKQWLDGTTGKPLDPKKPQILPIKPPK